MPPCVHLGPAIRNIGCCSGSIHVFVCKAPENSRFVCTETTPTKTEYDWIPGCYTCPWRKEPKPAATGGNFNFAPAPAKSEGGPRLDQTVTLPPAG